MAESENHKKKTMLFVHIPKSAGTTLGHTIKKLYDPETILSIYEQKDLAYFKNLTIRKKKKIRVLYGHLAFELRKYLPQRPTYITMLRNPVDRTISHYNHMIRPMDTHYHKLKNVEFKDFIYSDTCENEVNNLQTRYIAGKKHEKCSANMLKIAKSNLKNLFQVVGLTERFDESFMLMKREFGWKFFSKNQNGWKTCFYKKSNLNPYSRIKKEDIPKKVINIIKKKNMFDIELYKFAKKNFEKKISEEQLSFQIELQILRKINKLYYSIHPLYLFLASNCRRQNKS